MELEVSLCLDLSLPTPKVLNRPRTVPGFPVEFDKVRGSEDSAEDLEHFPGVDWQLVPGVAGRRSAVV